MNILARIGWGVCAATWMLFASTVEITSDEMKAYEEKKEVHFIGDANVSEAQGWIHADRMVVYLDEKNKIAKYVASGHVTFYVRNKESLYVGNADRMVYEPIKRIYVLQGHAKVEDRFNKRSVKGGKIVLNMATGHIRVQGAKVQGKRKEPVKFVFEVDEATKEKK